MKPVPTVSTRRVRDLVEEWAENWMWHLDTAHSWIADMRAAGTNSKRHREAAKRLIDEYVNTLVESGKALGEILDFIKLHPEFADEMHTHRGADNEPAWVYFAVRKNDGAVKIGYSVNPQRRLKEFQTGSGPCYLAAEMPGSMKDEKALHKRFAHRCVGGEWFAPNDEILELIRKWPLF